MAYKLGDEVEYFFLDKDNKVVYHMRFNNIQKAIDLRNRSVWLKDTRIAVICGEEETDARLGREGE